MVISRACGVRYELVESFRPIVSDYPKYGSPITHVSDITLDKHRHSRWIHPEVPTCTQLWLF